MTNGGRLATAVLVLTAIVLTLGSALPCLPPAYGYDGTPTTAPAVQPHPYESAELDERLDGRAGNAITDVYDHRSNLARTNARPGAYRWAPQGGARFVAGSDGVVTDLAPDLQSLARTHADEISLAGRPPTAAAAAVDRATGNVYFGQSGSVPTHIHPTLRSRMPSPSLEPWAVGNCAEFNACNAALWAGASIDDLVYGTVRTATRAPFPSCANCRIALQGAKEVL